MNKSIQKLKNQKLFFILIVIVAITSCKPEKVDLCDAYKDYFEGKGSGYTYEDSVNVLKYAQKLTELYSKNKDVYLSKTRPSPYTYIYEMKNYDTGLLFKVLDLYVRDSIKYQEEIGIHWSFAKNIIINDALIKGTVVDKINHYKECRYFTTTYFIMVDSIIHSYFPLSIGDTVLIHSNLFGVEGYCEHNKALGFGATTHFKDYKIGEAGLFFYLNRAIYVSSFDKAINKPGSKYKDPYCFNSFFRYPLNEGIKRQMKKTDKLKLSKFVNKIKK